MTVFCVQELIISVIYIWATVRFLRPTAADAAAAAAAGAAAAYRRRHTRSVMLQLLWINIAIIAMDLAMLTMEYMGKYHLEAVMKGAIYSVKLKLEFAVLNQLMQLASSSHNPALRSGNGHKTASPSPEGRNRYHDNYTRLSPRSRRRQRSGAASQRGGVRGFLRRFVPGTSPDASSAMDHDDNSYFISPSVLQSVHSTRHHQQQRNVTGQYNDPSGALVPQPPERGIALTTEIRQEISTPAEIRNFQQDDLDKAIFLQSESHTRNPSFEIIKRDRGASSESSRTVGHSSEIELVDLPSSPYSDQTGRSLYHYGSITAPEPTACSWSTRSYTNVLPRPKHHRSQPQILSSKRPSFANLRSNLRSSSEEQLRTS